MNEVTLIYELYEHVFSEALDKPAGGECKANIASESVAALRRICKQVQPSL